MWNDCESCERAHHHNTVFQLHSEYEKTSPMTFEDAELYCISQGGHLASIHSREEHDTVRAVARGERVWIGLNDRVWVRAAILLAVLACRGKSIAS